MPIQLTEYDNAIHWTDALEQRWELIVFDMMQPFFDQMIEYFFNAQKTAPIHNLFQLDLGAVQLAQAHDQTHNRAMWHLNAFAAIIDGELNFWAKCDTSVKLSMKQNKKKITNLNETSFFYHLWHFAANADLPEIHWIVIRFLLAWRCYFAWLPLLILLFVDQ